jgi:sugar lactone lactonase YvrE
MDWNGGGCSGICSPTYTHSTGYFVEPSSNNTTSGCTEVASYTWAGIGGWHDLNSTLAQDGTGQQAPNLGNDEAFYEVIHPKEGGEGTIATKFHASPGHYFIADTQYTGNNHYSFYMFNYANRTAFHAGATGALWGRTTEFIVERPREHNLYNFKSVTFQGFTNGKAFRQYPNERIDMQSGVFVKEQGFLSAASPTNILNNYEFTDNFHICTKAKEKTLAEELEGAGRGGLLPRAATEGSSEETETTAKLSGSVDPEGTYTTYHFEYGTEAENYSASTPENAVGEGTSSVPVSATVTGLQPGTTYHYRITANSAEGTAVGADKTFTTHGFPPPPPPTVTTEGASGLGRCTATLEATVNPNGQDTHYYFEYGTTSTLYDKFAPALPGNDAGLGTVPVHVSVVPTELMPSTTYYYRVVAGNSTGTSYGTEREFTTLFSPPVYSSQFGKPGSENGQFTSPSYNAIDASGNVWTTDSGDNRLEEFSGSGTFIRAVGSIGAGNGQFLYPLGIAINKSADDVYVADYSNHRIEEFSTSDGKFIRAFGSFGSGNGQLANPTGVAIDSVGNVWAVDGGNNRVEVFSSTGTFIAVYGKLGSGNGQFTGPQGITINSSDHVYVADYGNNRVEELSSEGVYLRQFGSNGSGNGQFGGPYGIANDERSGDIFVTDQGGNRIEVFTPTGTYLGQFGTFGSGNGQFSVIRGITIGPSGYVYVIDGGNDRVQKFLPGGC